MFIDTWILDKIIIWTLCHFLARRHWQFLIQFSIRNSISHSWIKIYILGRDFPERGSWSKTVGEKVLKSSNIFISVPKSFSMKVVVATICKIYVVKDSLISRSSCNIMSMLQICFPEDSPPIPYRLHMWDIFSRRR